jgi:hypothetical protein
MAVTKVAAAVNDPESLVNYLAAQGARMTDIGETLIADTKQAYQLGVDLLSETQQVAQENVVSITEMTNEKPVSKKAAA